MLYLSKRDKKRIVDFEINVLLKNITCEMNDVFVVNSSTSNQESMIE